MSDEDAPSGKTVPGFTPDLGDRINRVIREIGTQKRAAEIVGVRPETVAGWRKGEQKPSFYDMVTLCRAAGKSITWLATGEEPRDSSAESGQHPVGTQPEHGGSPVHQIVNREAMEAGAFVLVPRLDVQVSAGSGSFAIDEHVREFIAFDPSYLRAAGIDPRAAHVVQVDGRSMMPNLVHGEWVIVDASATAILNGAIYALVLNGVALVKRLRRIKGGGVMVISDNKDEGYEDEVVEGEELNDLRIVGRVRKHIRSL